MTQEMANNLNTFKTHLDDYGRGYRDLVKDFEAVVTHMNALNGMWTGQAQEVLMQRFEQDRLRAQNLIDYLKQIMDDLQFASTEYAKCENKVTGIVDSVRV